MSLLPFFIVLLYLLSLETCQQGTFRKKNSIPPREREPDRVRYLLMVIM